MVKLGWPPLPAALAGFCAGLAAGAINGFLATKGRLPAFVVTLGMFYMARGIAAWLAAGRQLQGFSRALQPARPQVHPGPDRLGHRARRRARPCPGLGLQHPDPDPAGPRGGLRADPLADALWLHGEGDRRQHPRRRLRRHRHRPGPLPQLHAERRLRLGRRGGLHRVLPLLQSARRHPARARRHRRGDHRRRQHLRRLRLGAGLARRRRGDHPCCAA